MTGMPRSKASSSGAASFFAGGYGQLLEAIENETRPAVEGKYTLEWNSGGMVKRWFLKRKIEREVSKLVAARVSHVSRDALF